MSQQSCWESLKNFLCCISLALHRTPYQFVCDVGSPPPQNAIEFQSNFIRTAHYRWYSFLPKALLLQFLRIANIYFLIIAVLQTIPVISPLSPIIAWGPLIIVLGISMLREAYEDYQRYKSDKEVNHELKTEVMREGAFRLLTWSELVVGDLVRVKDNEFFPADLLLLTSTSDGGTAFIETASLDGEKNLKLRKAHQKTRHLQEPQISLLKATFSAGTPEKSLAEFNGKLTLHAQEEIFFKSIDQFMYRGAKLKNTKNIVGMVIYTGQNTKIMLNSGLAEPKMSQIQRKVNKMLGVILLFQVLLCIVLAILYGDFRNKNEAVHTYLNWPSSSVAVDSIISFFTYLVLLNTMIPISLIVSIEIVKLSQSYFINNDKLMYSAFRKVGSSVKSASLNEQLGQIEYIFSDKTGTLTMNLMQLKIMVIGKTMFGDRGLVSKGALPTQKQKGFYDKELKELMTGGGANSPLPIPINMPGKSINSLKELAEEYMMLLATTHNVVVNRSEQGVVSYEGPSPDDIALVESAKLLGYQFLKATQNSTTLQIRGSEKQFTLLEQFPFTSDRKRSSVLIRDNNIIKLYMKGADSIMLKRAAPNQNLDLSKQLNDFSVIGLRTLLLGMKIIRQDQYNKFRKEVGQLPKDAAPGLYEEIVSRLEENVYLIGATAVLDHLQDQVPETIADLIRANIKVWMLTGDKYETAENIAKSCRLFQPQFQILRYNFKQKPQALGQITRLTQLAIKLQSTYQRKGLIIEDRSLAVIIGDVECQKAFAHLSEYCDSVVCCRMAPIQKAEVVRIVKEHLNKITLSIGDGANDVPMIKQAHIGIGLYGEEGNGAVQASDYALPEFRMLWRLLLVHGRWNYLRIAEMILYFFYKNMLYTMPHFFFAFFNGFSGQTIFDGYYIALYNLAFTSFPLVVRAILEQDVNYILAKNQVEGQPDRRQKRQMKVHSGQHLAPIKAADSKKYIPQNFSMNKYMYRLFPRIYFIGQQNLTYNIRNFILWIIEGILQSILITLFCFFILSTQSVSEAGYSPDLWLLSLTCYSTIVVVVTFKLCAHTKFWSGSLVLSIVVLSLGSYVAYMWLSNFFFSDYVLFTVSISWTTGEAYFIVLFGSCLVLALDGYLLTIDFKNGGYASKMRLIIDEEKQINRQFINSRISDKFSVTEMSVQNNSTKNIKYNK